MPYCYVCSLPASAGAAGGLGGPAGLPELHTESCIFYVADRKENYVVQHTHRSTQNHQKIG